MFWPACLKLDAGYQMLCIALLTLFLLGACQQQTPSVTTIGVLLFGDSRQPQVDGFVDEMSAAGFSEGESTRYVILNAKNDRKKLPYLVEELLSHSPDLLVAAGGLEADVMNKSKDILGAPVVVLYVNAIVERGLVESRSQSGWNVTGVDNLNAELSGKRVELIKDMLPDTKRILILYYEKIAPSRNGVKEAISVASKLDIEIVARAVKSRDEIKAAMASIKLNEFDAMLTVPTAPIDNALKDIILPKVKELKLPLFTHSRPLAELGALASYGASFYELGKQSARLGLKVLNGVKASNIPFEIPRNYVFTINRDVQQFLGIQLNEITTHQIDDYVVTRQ